MRLGTSERALTFRYAQQRSGPPRLIGTFDVDQLNIPEYHGPLDQPRSGFAEHHSIRRRHRLHPLGHPDLFTDGGVTRSARADLAGNHLTGVDADPQAQVDRVTSLDFVR